MGANTLSTFEKETYIYLVKTVETEGRISPNSTHKRVSKKRYLNLFVASKQRGYKGGQSKKDCKLLR